MMTHNDHFCHKGFKLPPIASAADGQELMIIYSREMQTSYVLASEWFDKLMKPYTNKANKEPGISYTTLTRRVDAYWAEDPSYAIAASAAGCTVNGDIGAQIFHYLKRHGIISGKANKGLLLAVECILPEAMTMTQGVNWPTLQAFCSHELPTLMAAAHHNRGTAVPDEHRRRQATVQPDEAERRRTHPSPTDAPKTGPLPSGHRPPPSTVLPQQLDGSEEHTPPRDVQVSSLPARLRCR